MEESRSPAQHRRANAQGPDPLIGRVINERYRVVATIARGGMGKVYRAEQQPLGRLVALKVLSPNYTGENDPEFHKRFFLEASIASKLSHPNTVTIFDYGKTDDDIYYIAMELLEGRTLHRALREEAPLTAERTMHIARQICRSLREAHNLGVIHRDLKPANVYLLDHGDESDVVKVLDFGLVKNLLDKSEELTQAGLFMGSPKYMSPEQIRGDACDGRVDIYALGVMMYEMLTGKVPFDRQNSVNILMAHIHEDVPPISAMNPRVHVSPQLETLVRKCMAKSADARFTSMESLLAALKQMTGFSANMSGEYGVQNFSDVSRSVELPLPTPINARGDMPFPKGSVTEIDHRTLGKLASFGTPANGQTMVDTMVGPTGVGAAAAGAAPAPAAKRGAGKLALVGLCAAVVLGGVGLFVNTRLAKHSGGDTARAQQPASSPVASAAHDLARDAPVPAVAEVQTSVLVSLRSTPSGAMVTAGGKEYGPTPTQVEWTGSEASIGREVTFRFQRRGFQDVTVTRQIRGAQLEVDAPRMDPAVERPVTPAPAPRAASPRPASAPPVARAPVQVEPVAPVLDSFKASPY